jgi:cytochrome P450
VATAVEEIPAHVPAELLQDFPLHDAPGIDSDPPRAMDALRDGRPIIYAPASRRGRGTWVIRSYDLLVEALQDYEIFSSDRYSGFSQLMGESWPMLPLEVDPPLHRPYRMLMNKVFAPSRMMQLEDGIAETVRELVDAVRPQGGCEFQTAFGMPLPTTVFLRLMGLPLDDAQTLLKWENLLLHGADMAERVEAATSIRNYLVGHIEDRTANPRDDVVSYLANSAPNGAPATADEKLGMCFVLYGAGLDTVAASLGFIFKFLAENQDKQAELRTRPDIRAKAIEEMLRANSMVAPGRWVAKDTVFHGVEMKKGDFVTLPTMFGNRDETLFDDPKTVDFDRGNVMRHIGFGSGAHNCLGSHLARRELKIALDAWMDHMPPFHLGNEPPVTYGGSVFGVQSLTLAW